LPGRAAGRAAGGCKARSGDETGPDFEAGLRVRPLRHRKHFCIVEPLAGRRLTFASADRKRPAYVRALQKIAARYPQAKRIHLVQDNLNTHSLKSAVAVLGALEGRRLWRRFEVHYTPKHASWLNAAEIEASLVSRECLGRDRLAFLVDLISRVAAWRRAVEDEGRTIDWTFRVDDARRKFRYDGLITARSRH